MTKLGIARKVRRVCEEYAKLTKEFDSSLSCMCAIASNALAEEFNRGNFPANLIFGEYYTYCNKYRDYFHAGFHCWVLCDNMIWDLTATQYAKSKNKIFITDIEDPCFKKGMIVNDIMSVFSHWPLEQQPSLSQLDVLQRVIDNRRNSLQINSVSDTVRV
jgi:hypothetical protein